MAKTLTHASPAILIAFSLSAFCSAAQTVPASHKEAGAIGSTPETQFKRLFTF